MSSLLAVARVTEITVSVSRPCILIIDDEEKFLNKAREFFQRCGYDVDTARTPEEAEQLNGENENKYQVVACDINFGPLSNTKGDKFIIENPLLFGKAKRVIISAGEWLTPERKEQLRQAEIAFVEKTTKLNKKLAEITQKENEKWAKDVARIVKKEAGPTIEKITGGSVNIRFAGAPASGAAAAPAVQTVRRISELATERMKQTIINWLETRGELDEPVFAYGKHVYSANEMIREVKSETQVGFEHIEMLLEEFEHSLEVDVDDPQHYDDDEHSE